MGNNNAAPGEGARDGILADQDDSEYGEFEPPSMAVVSTFSLSSMNNRLLPLKLRGLQPILCSQLVASTCQSRSMQ